MLTHVFIRILSVPPFPTPPQPGAPAESPSTLLTRCRAHGCKPSSRAWLAAAISRAFTTSRLTHSFTASCWVSNLAYTSSRNGHAGLPCFLSTTTTAIPSICIHSPHLLLPSATGGDPTLRTWIGVSSLAKTLPPVCQAWPHPNAILSLALVCILSIGGYDLDGDAFLPADQRTFRWTDDTPFDFVHW